MLFIPNKYTKCYFGIITKAQNRNITNVYLEEHHIIPESLFKNRNRSGKVGHVEGDPEAVDNKVKLTAREHFICHWLLTKMTEGDDRKKMIYALRRTTQSTKHRTKITSRVYQNLREEFSKIHSERMSQPRKPGTGQNISAAKTGKKREPFTEEWKQNLSKSCKGVPKTRIMCPHCNKIGGSQNMKRWHFDNCKLKP
ncbi:MAG TPA: hypothetical protein VFM18_17190 [Methanosarcina sp.]|nr:hypothetical protein [Methanosarcina sp.]